MEIRRASASAEALSMRGRNLSFFLASVKKPDFRGEVADIFFTQNTKSRKLKEKNNEKRNELQRNKRRSIFCIWKCLPGHERTGRFFHDPR